MLLLLASGRRGGRARPVCFLEEDRFGSLGERPFRIVLWQKDDRTGREDVEEDK